MVFKTFYFTKNMSLVEDGGTSETFLKGYFEKPGILKSPVPKILG
jgi:hypothetical protein